MRGKISLLAGGAIGYVLGTRAGRERYEQIVSKARELAGQPKVQQAATKAQSAASDLASTAKDKTNDAITTVSDKASSATDSATTVDGLDGGLVDLSGTAPLPGAATFPGAAASDTAPVL